MNEPEKPPVKAATVSSLISKEVVSAMLNFIVPLAAILISGAIALLVIVPSLSTIPVLKDELSAAASKRDELQLKVTNLKNLVDYKAVVDEDSTLVNRVLPSESFVPKLMDQIKQIVDESGMQLNQISYSYGDKASASPDAASTVNISVNTTGTYAQLTQLMELIEKAARIVSVSNFRYSGTGDLAKGIDVVLAVDAPYLFVQSNAVTDDPVSINIASQSFVNNLNVLKVLRYYDFSGVTETSASVKETSASVKR